MDEDKAPDGFLLTEEDLEGITEDDLDELEMIADEYVELVDQFEDDVDDVLDRINDSTVYEKLGKELHISVEYLYQFGEREE